MENEIEKTTPKTSYSETTTEKVETPAKTETETTAVEDAKEVSHETPKAETTSGEEASTESSSAADQSSTESSTTEKPSTETSSAADKTSTTTNATSKTTAKTTVRTTTPRTTTAKSTTFKATTVNPTTSSVKSATTTVKTATETAKATAAAANAASDALSLHLIQAGIVLCTLTIGGSLTVYSHPELTWNDYVDIGKSAYHKVATPAKKLAKESGNKLFAFGGDIGEQLSNLGTYAMGGGESDPDGAPGLNIDEIVSSLEEPLALVTENPYEITELQPMVLDDNTAHMVQQAREDKIDTTLKDDEAYFRLISSASTPEENSSNPYVGLRWMFGAEEDSAYQALYEATKQSGSDYFGAESDHDIILHSVAGNMAYYNQSDSHWSNYKYGGKDPVGDYGCGPTAVAMVVNAFSTEDEPISPMDVCDWAAANGQFSASHGSYHSIVPKGVAAYGLKAESVEDPTPESLTEILQDGNIMVALMGKGTFTSTGHFIIIREVDGDGNLKIADPNSYVNTEQSWDPQLIIDELMNRHDNGGPLWVIKQNGDA